MDKIKKMLQQFQKSPEQQKRKQRKVWELKTVSRLLSFLGLGVLLFVGVTFVKAYTTQNKIDQLSTQVKQLKEQLSLTDGVIESVDRNALEFYLDNFMTVYMTVTPVTQQRNERQLQLNQYYAKNTLQMPIVSDSSRKWLRGKLIQLRYANGKYFATYYVQYEISDPVEKTKEEQGRTVKYIEDVKKVVNGYYTIPFTQQDNQFQVVAEPFVTARPDVAYQDSITPYVIHQKITDIHTGKKLDTFVLNFLTKYHGNVLTDLAYMMEKPYGLNKQFTVKKLVKQEYDMLENGLIKAYIQVELLDSRTQFIKVEFYELLLGQKDNNYIVKEIVR